MLVLHFVLICITSIWGFREINIFYIEIYIIASDGSFPLGLDFLFGKLSLAIVDAFAK